MKLQILFIGFSLIAYNNYQHHVLVNDSMGWLIIYVEGRYANTVLAQFIVVAISPNPSTFAGAKVVINIDSAKFLVVLINIINFDPNID